MKLQEYIEKLKDGTDFEEGYLSDLAEDIPKELHPNIMKAVSGYNLKQKRFMFGKYLTAVAAVFIFILCISGLKNFSGINSQNKAATEKKAPSLSAAQDSKNEVGRAENLIQGIREEARTLIESFEIETQEQSILNYLQLNGQNIGNNIFLLNKNSFEELKGLLNRNNVKLKKLEDGSVPIDYNKIKNNISDFVIIKTIQ